PFTRAQKELLRNYVVSCWKNKNPEDIHSVNQFLTIQEQLDPLDEGRRVLVKAQIRKAMLPELRKHPEDRLAKMLTDADDAGHRPIAAGTPPLTRQATDAWMEMIVFIITESSGLKTYVPTEAEKSQ